MRVSTWPFRSSRAYNETVSRDHRRAKLLALLVPAGVVAVILPYSRLLFHGAAYPVVGDPKYTWGWVTGTVYLNRNETSKLMLGTGLATLITGRVWFISVPFGTITAYANYVYNEGRCIKVKIIPVSRKGLANWELDSYGGNHAGGYCR